MEPVPFETEIFGVVPKTFPRYALDEISPAGLVAIIYVEYGVVFVSPDKVNGLFCGTGLIDPSI
jgi:hypothetical protein